MDKKTELHIETECNLTLKGFMEVMKDIEKLEKEHNCRCTLIKVKLVDMRNFGSK